MSSKKVTTQTTANCPVWTYEQIIDPRFREALSREICNMNGVVDLQLADGVIRVSIRQAFLNLYWFPIALEFGIPICKRHFIRRLSLNSGSHAKALNLYYDEIMGIDSHNAKRLKQAIWRTYNELYAVSSTELLPYSNSISMVDMAEILTDPQMDPLIHSRDKIAELVDRKEAGEPVVIDTKAIEDDITVNSDKIMKLLGTKGALKNQALTAYSNAGMLNKFQVPQTMLAFGVRTDVSDKIVNLPVASSAVTGLRNIHEFAVESLSAKKSVFYNHSAVRRSQYFGRKQNLMASSISTIYNGDCGAEPVPFNVTEKSAPNLVGKIIRTEDGKRDWIRPDNYKSFIGKTVFIRSPLTCRHTDGVCEICGGKVIQNFNRKLNVGIESAMQNVEPDTQGILSAKHLIKANSIIHKLSRAALQYFVHTSGTEIKWQMAVSERLAGSWLGVRVEDFVKFSDVIYIRRGKAIVEEAYSSIHNVILKGSKDEIVELDMVDGAQVPYFSTRMLTYIRDHFKTCKIEDGVIWIPLTSGMNFPIFKVVVINDSLVEFVRQIEKFLGEKIRDFTTCHDALQTFADLTYSKVKVNLVHVEILLKSYMVSGTHDFAVPCVQDQNNVMFQNSATILSHRHVGTCLAYERLGEYLSSPATYLKIKSGSPFDRMIGYTDK